MAKNGKHRVFLIRCPWAMFSLNGRHVIETSPNILYSQLSSLLNLAKREETNPSVKIQKKRRRRRTRVKRERIKKERDREREEKRWNNEKKEGKGASYYPRNPGVIKFRRTRKIACRGRNKKIQSKRGKETTKGKRCYVWNM